ncbi:acetamidase/formamidase [Nocardia transvalensis]|uniref:Acetamidase/formamidase n=1 Tax=Nocardia transvalensis TaxID=37333 RepID=A0A7W9PLJ2_9NOCA|nr:acetamidase/formamidase family protein [Nocardia transvalensis]MBB5918367.1 acetamidase/formamidase [Nocardia transvalensis]
MTSSVQERPAAFPVLQQGDGVGGNAVYVPADPGRVLWGRVPCAGDSPVATVAPGTTVVVDTVSHEGILADQGSDPVAYFGRHGVARDQVLADAVEVTATRTREAGAGPHIVTGPIAIAGARPGDLLAVRVDDLVMRAPYGVVSTRHGRGVLAGDPDFDGSYGQFCTVHERDGDWFGAMPIRHDRPAGARFPLAPFLGIMGVATDTTSRLDSTPPGPHGGNIDIRLLTPGATLFLPVQVPDALFYIGDPHFAQGDGEVALTAFEAPLRATLTLDVVAAEQVSGLSRAVGPFAAGHGLVIPTGLDADLNAALGLCVRNAIELVVALFDADPRQAYLYLSAAADFTVSQAVDLVRGVHGEVRVADFDGPAATGFARYILERAR